jgi:hypothetical protein
LVKWFRFAVFSQVIIEYRQVVQATGHFGVFLSEERSLDGQSLFEQEYSLAILTRRIIE